MAGTGAGAAAAVRTGHVRLTRRGRLAVVLSMLTFLVVGFSATGHVASQAAAPTGVEHARTVTVQPGETLWAVAVRIAPHADPRLVVARIAQINHLAGAEVFAGQQLVVPVVS
ncbi:MAG TPA: LysM peptidoglycan-binding domain-containing protein [Mycobacteriales bacterium]|nr:LysM peptidoglycan-binding domain-containing protein [Mycobacteriales bacterium]